MPLGSSQVFMNWGKGSVGSVKSQPPALGPSTNMYAALENMNDDKRPISKYSKYNGDVEKFQSPSHLHFT